MALASVFYDGPSTETDRAMYRAGAPDYGVIGPDDFRVSTHPSIPYALLVKAGEAHGHGVTDKPAMPGEDQLVQCAPLSGGGAVRWDLVVVRRNWQPLLGGPSTLVVIQGGTTAPNIQTIRKIGPGVEDDQPLALVEWRGGVNTPKSIIDLRCWAATGGAAIVDKLALTYLAKPGAMLTLDNRTLQYLPIGNGVWDWVSRSPASGTVVVAIPAANSYKSVEVRLPDGFTSAPKVLLTITSNVAFPATRLQAVAINKTTKKFDAKLATVDGAKIGTPYSISIDWLAI